MLAKWRSMGYKIALWRDADSQTGTGAFDESLADLLWFGGKYPGYAQAVNFLISRVMRIDLRAEWLIAAGDDTLPDSDHAAEEIGEECKAHFRGLAFSRLPDGTVEQTSPFDSSGTFGVMQPTGDRFAQGQIDRIAGSAWIGREFARGAYGGNGPLWHEYTHMWVDEELKHVAEKYGVYWIRPDLVHLHMHWQRESAAINSNAIGKPESARPAHMHPSSNDGYTQLHWKKYEKIFKDRRAVGFPGSELL